VAVSVPEEAAVVPAMPMILPRLIEGPTLRAERTFRADPAGNCPAWFTVAAGAPVDRKGVSGQPTHQHEATSRPEEVSP
jgi:hypothetical protein